MMNRHEHCRPRCLLQNCSETPGYRHYTYQPSGKFPQVFFLRVCGFHGHDKRTNACFIIYMFQYANMIRASLDAHTSVVPAVLEIPSKDCPYDPSSDSILRRARVSSLLFTRWSFSQLYCRSVNFFSIIFTIIFLYIFSIGDCASEGLKLFWFYTYNVCVK